MKGFDLVVVALLATGSEDKPSPNGPLTREQRLAQQKAELESTLEAMDRFGHHDEFLAAVKKVADELLLEEGDQFSPVADGNVQENAFVSFSTWQSPRGSRDRPLAIDLETEHHPYACLVDLNVQARKLGMDFLLVVVPTRIEVYPDLLIPLPDMKGFAGMGRETIRFLLELNRAGVETLALAPHLARERGERGELGDLYLRTDPHWTPRGAEVAAKVVAERVARYPWFKPGTVKQGKSFEVRDLEFVFTSGDELASRGAEPQTVRGNSLGGTGALFEAVDHKSSIVLLGDSYARVFRLQACDFCTQFSRFSGHKLDVVMAAGDGVQVARRKLARRPPEKWARKKLLIWLLSEGGLGNLGERWDPVPFELPDSAVK